MFMDRSVRPKISSTQNSPRPHLRLSCREWSHEVRQSQPKLDQEIRERQWRDLRFSLRFSHTLIPCALTFRGARPNYATLAVKSSAGALPEIFITRDTTAATPKFSASAGNAAYTP